MLGRWFSVDFVDQFVVVLLRDVSPMISGPEPKGSKPKKAAKHKDRLEMGLTALHRRAVDFGRQEKLNFFQKARLSKRLQDGLIRSGQSAEFAKDFAVRVIADLR
ncbi:MAG: hypothetical protein IPO95_11330 [Rhodanobacteraceae bacterium]|jgi:hypothetical protein|nr:hypothetical protein [Rhodanobacteraceae bacterium]MBL0042596.1 hypothetical protein [Xanthomonadales bacterium]